MQSTEQAIQKDVTHWVAKAGQLVVKQSVGASIGGVSIVGEGAMASPYVKSSALTSVEKNEDIDSERIYSI